MFSNLSKKFHLCFSNKLKHPTTIQSPPTPLTQTQQNHNRPSPTAASSSILIKNFNNSLYDLTASDSLSRSSDNFSSSNSDTDTTTATATTPPDFATIFASQRFFFSSPGRSNSIVDSKLYPPESDTLVCGGLPIPTYSSDLYKDFLRSMQEMIEARGLLDVRSDCDYLHELLLCYLALNPTHTHKFIIAAFADLVLNNVSSKDHR